MITKCYIMSDDQLNRIDRKLIALRHNVEAMRKSERRDDLIKAIRSIQAEFTADDFRNGGECDD